MRLLLGGAYFWEGAYYRSLISSLQQMRLLLGGAYYRGALIIGSLRYITFRNKIPAGKFDYMLNRNGLEFIFLTETDDQINILFTSIN